MSSSLGYTLLDNKESPSIHHNPTIKSKLNKLLHNKTIKKPPEKRITPEMVQSINDDMTGKKGESNYSLNDEDDEGEDDFRSIQQESQSLNQTQGHGQGQVPTTRPSRNGVSMSVSDISSGTGSGSGIPSAISNIYNDKPTYFDQYKESSPDNAFNQYANSVNGSRLDTGLTSTSFSMPSNNTSSMYTNTSNGMEFHSPSSQSELLTKLNYMIHMLEEQQEHKTNSVVEELILYCFLGVFIIFMIDSFAKVGKYTR
mgnify:CR=1